MSNSPHRARRRSLARDERGAILIPGFFVIAFFSGILYMLIGGATAMRHGTLMQEGADSASFSAAQMRASSMNQLAVLNRVKESASAALAVPPSVIDGVTEALEFVDGGGGDEADREELEDLLEEAEEAETSAQDVAQRLLRASDDAQQAILDTLPDLIEGLLNEHLVPGLGPPVETIFFSPLFSMPISREDLGQHCARIFPEGQAMIAEAFDAISSPAVASVGLAEALREFPDHCEARANPGVRLDDSVTQGGEELQVHAFAGGAELSDLGERGVRLAAWGADPGPDEFSRARDELSRLAFGQGETYFDDDVTREEALRDTQWEARLRRFRLPPGASIVADCRRQNGPQQACARLRGFIERMEFATAH